MGEKKEKKEMSKGMRIFIIILLSILFIYLLLGLIFTAKDGLSKGGTPVLFSICLILVLDIFCAYGVIKNILKLTEKDKQELTAELLQKRKKFRNALIIIPVIIVGLVGGISLSNVFDGGIIDTKKEALDPYVGTWEYWDPFDTKNENSKSTIYIDGKGNYTLSFWSSITNKTTSFDRQYKIDGDIIILDGREFKITSNTVFTAVDGVGRYYKK